MTFADMLLREPPLVWWTQRASGTLCCCKWCGKDLSGASQITYLNGNQACCDLCLISARKDNK